MASTLFISDLHLDPARPATTRAFANFLQSNSRCERLFILGDLFDSWIGDDDDASIALQVRDLLAQFSSGRPELFLMQGNRDFLLGEAFCHSVGGQLLGDPTVIDLYGTPTLLLHGDSLCTDDVQYQAFRKMTREPQWQAEALGHTLGERRLIAGQLRGMSKESTSNKAEDIMDVNSDAVAHALHDHSAKQMIHGHTHRPAHHVEAAGSRWVLGDWDENAWVLEVTDKDAKFNIIDIKQYVI